MSVTLSIQADVARVQRSLSALAEKQLPFAAAQACTTLAQQVQAEERKALVSVFDRPTPFTVNSVGAKAARKTQPEAVVYIRDIAASYLNPYEVGGEHKLIGTGKTRPNPKRRGRSKVPAGSNTTGRLKLLVRFGDALPVRQHLDYRERADWVIRKQFNKAFGQALARALATAKPR